MSHKHEFTDSSNIAHCDWHEPDTLEICFKSGGTYHYKGATKDHYEALKAAASPGQHFHREIRRKFQGEKID